MKITVYSQTVCGECEKLKAVLKGAGIPFEEINVDKDAKAMDYIKNELGAMGTPVTVVEANGGKETVYGFHIGQIQTALGY